LLLVPIEVGQTIRLNNIFFPSKKFDLLPESFPELNRVVDLLNSNPDIKIQINGHTDNVGQPSENMLLSRRRAKSVSEYLSPENVANRDIPAGKDGMVEYR